jgi:DNA-binding winged helix-turn-helix (wHTH) protein
MRKELKKLRKGMGQKVRAKPFVETISKTGFPLTRSNTSNGFRAPEKLLLHPVSPG